MTFGEKVREARLALNLSQSELAQMTGISERSLYTYEQLGIIPRSGNIKKLAAALNLSVTYLMDEEETDKSKDIGRDAMIEDVKRELGTKGAREAGELLDRAGALFAGGELDEEAKDVFFRALMEVYLDSKQAARDKYTPRKFRKHPSES